MTDSSLALIVCTFNRPEAIKMLLGSVSMQSILPVEVIVVDGSTSNETSLLFREPRWPLNLRYFLVGDDHRGLTRQRNFGLSVMSENIEIVAFLDDDVSLEKNYFESLLKTYSDRPDAVGIGGYITNEVQWCYKGVDYSPTNWEYCFDGWVRQEQGRMILRKWMGLYPDKPPGYQPPFSHGLSMGYLPPSGEVYEVTYFMGGVSSYKASLFARIRFSEYFHGYGLYEDFDFTLRASRIGKLYVDTKARLAHYHEPSGRPNRFQFGTMVTKNGWYVWRVGNADPKLRDKIKWWMITFLLLFSRALSIVKGPGRVEAFTEVIGRCYGVISIVLKAPTVRI